MTVAELERNEAADAVEWAHGALSLGFVDIAGALNANERTVRRWHEKEAAPRGRHREKLDELREFRHMVQVVFGRTAEGKAWLRQSLPALRGRTPISLLRKGQLKPLIEILATVESGAFV